MMVRVPLILCAALCAATAGCGKDEAIASASSGTGGTGASGGSAGASGSGGSSGTGGSAGTGGAEVDAGPPVRSVETRNPFGNTETTDNVLIDGDFELTAGSGQYGWQAISTTAPASLERETGGLCFSGVTCGVLTGDANLIAFGTAADGVPMEASLRVKHPEGDCGGAGVSVISCTGLSVFPGSGTAVPPVAATPDASGWCEYRAMVPAMDTHPCLLLEARSPSRMLVDDARLVAASSETQQLLKLGPKLDARTVEVAERVLRIVHRHRLIGSPAKRAPSDRR